MTIKFEIGKTYIDSYKSKFSETIKVVKRTDKMIHFIYTGLMNPTIHKVKVRDIDDYAEKVYITQNYGPPAYFMATDAL